MIRTRPVTKEYEDGFNKIFRKKILIDNGGSVGVDLAKEGSKDKTVCTLILYDKNGSYPLKNFSYDPTNDIYTIYGVKYTGEFFKKLGENGMAIGTKFEVTKREDNSITIMELK